MAVNPGHPPKRVTMKAFGPSRTKRVTMPAIKNPRKKSRGPNTKRLIKLGKLLDSPKTRTRAKRIMVADGLKKMLAVNPRKKVKKNSSARKHARRPKKNPRVRLQKMESSMKYRRRKKNPKSKKRARRNPSKRHGRKIRRMRRNPGKKQKAAIKKLPKNVQESAIKSADAAKGRKSKSKKSKSKGGKRRSAAQRAATKKLIALNKSKKGSKKSKSKKSKSKSKGRRASIKRMGRKGRKGGKRSRRYVSSAKGYSIAIHRKSGLSAGNKKAYNAMLSSAKANPSLSGALAAAKEIFPQIGAGALGLIGLGYAGMKANEMLQKQSFSSYIPGPIKPYSGAIITGLLTAGAYMLAGRVKPLAKYKGAIAIGGGIASLVQVLLASPRGQDLLSKAGFPSAVVIMPPAGAAAGFGDYTTVGSGADNLTEFSRDSLRGLDDRSRFSNDSLSGMDDASRFAPGEGGILSGKMF